MEKTIIGPYISNDMLVCDSVDEFLEPFKSSIDIDLNCDMHLDFDIFHKSINKRISPILTLARPEDVKEIIKIYDELYLGNYPYREMLDVNEVREMINSPNYYFILFKDNIGSIAGCITFVLDFSNKRGYIRGFLLRKKYQQKLDIIKAMMGSMIWMCTTFKNKILVWYVENRTAHAKSQYPMWVCGIKPIGFYPNKDIFFYKVESDLMQIIYDTKALEELGSRELPKLIPEALNCYQYSSLKFNLSKDNVSISPQLKFDKNKIIGAQSRIKRKIMKDKFGYYYIKIYLLGTDSYLKFLYTPQVQNFEKTEYKVENLEQLSVFAQDFKMLADGFNTRYCEVFVPASEAEHQQIFYDAGLRPRGYIPSWKFNPNTKRFEDHILFNSFRGNIDKNIQLIEEGRELLSYLNFNI
jgi:hypothetical protein